ncbi:MAG: hypothetical protein Q9160_006181 [Pyrenula sp. 1 TL-2023]
MLPIFAVRSRCKIAENAGERVCDTLETEFPFRRRTYPYGFILRQADGLCDMCRENLHTGPWDREEHIPTIIHYTRAIDHLQRTILFLYHLGLWPTHTDGPMCPSLSKLTQRHLWTKAGLDNLTPPLIDFDVDLLDRYTLQMGEPIDIEVLPEFNRFMDANNGYTELGIYPQDLVAPLPPLSRPVPPRLHDGTVAMTAMSNSTHQSAQVQPQQEQQQQQSPMIIHRTPSAQAEHDEGLRQIIRHYEPEPEPEPRGSAHHRRSPALSNVPSFAVPFIHPPPPSALPPSPTQSYIPSYALVFNGPDQTSSHTLPYSAASNSASGHSSFQVLGDLEAYVNEDDHQPQQQVGQPLQEIPPLPTVLDDEFLAPQPQNSEAAEETAASLLWGGEEEGPLIAEPPVAFEYGNSYGNEVEALEAMRNAYIFADARMMAEEERFEDQF